MIIIEDSGKPGIYHLRSNQSKDSQAMDEYGWLEEFVETVNSLNQRTRTSLRDQGYEFIYDLNKKGFFKKFCDSKTEREILRLFDKVLGLAESGGAPLRTKALVVFMKLGRGIPYEVILKEEMDAGASFEAARKRVYRAQKLRYSFGLPTRHIPIEKWEALERLKQLLKSTAVQDNSIYGI